MLMIIITLICVAASKYRDSKTFSFHWRRLLSFYIIYYYYLSWKILKLLLLQHRMNKWMNEWRNELWKMLSCRIFHLTLNCSMWRDECRQFIIFLLLFSLSFPFLLLSLNFHKFSSIHLLKNSYSMFIHPATHTKKVGIIRSKSRQQHHDDELAAREGMNEWKTEFNWMDE